jgi:hypothetical protein
MGGKGREKQGKMSRIEYSTIDESRTCRKTILVIAVAVSSLLEVEAGVVPLVPV